MFEVNKIENGYVEVSDNHYFMRIAVENQNGTNEFLLYVSPTVLYDVWTWQEPFRLSDGYYESFSSMKEALKKLSWFIRKIKPIEAGVVVTKVKALLP